MPEQRTGTRKVVDYTTETRTRNRKVVQYNEETRTRTRKVMSYQTQTKTESYPYVSYKTEKRTKEVSFTMQVPEQVVEPYQETRYEQVSEQVVEEYQVQVAVPTMKEAQVQVMRMVPKLVPYTYTPCCSLQQPVATVFPAILLLGTDVAARATLSVDMTAVQFPVAVAVSSQRSQHLVAAKSLY